MSTTEKTQAAHGGPKLKRHIGPVGLLFAAVGSIIAVPSVTFPAGAVSTTLSITPTTSTNIVDAKTVVATARPASVGGTFTTTLAHAPVGPYVEGG